MPIHQCPHCDRVFQSSTVLSNHIRVHTGEQPFGCDVCGRKFSVPGSLSRHMLIHTGARDHVCNICQRDFRTKQQLKRHLNTHAQQRPHECGICGANFSRKDSLVRHERIHSAERPYKCDVCGKTFNRLDGANSHKLSRHPDQASGSVRSTAVHSQVEPSGVVTGTTLTITSSSHTKTISDVASQMGSAHVEVTYTPSATLTTVTSATGESVSSVDYGVPDEVDPYDLWGISTEDASCQQE
ncbi:C2H2-type zinc finger protein [Endozoicomonas euniceicola]|uniref:C2H2-type zinc finger protein n=1 Tax=Endozoicomonas euniceicola TaxID=1234143 RepID=A0ABY6GV24_9GAMM|nr:C2H2-type zinc finger protein [Endozoicomonas euniceicola]UYM16627.1 C2H2-type zinc finger protein [Endozoicomonas euniceicola]